MRTHLKYILPVLGTLVFISVVYLCLWGKLFPYSPVIVGFTKHEFAHAVIYLQKGYTVAGYQEIDAWIPVVEHVHELHFHTKPKIFFFHERGTYARRSPSTARALACYNGNIVVSPWAVEEAQEGTISLEIYVKHELSHALLFQNAGILRAYKYPKWLLEGIAVYSTNQMGTSWYPSQHETYAFIRQGNFLPPQDFKTEHEDRVPLNVPHRSAFIYSEFACIVDNLVHVYGKDTFVHYMTRLLKETHHNAVFEAVYGIDFGEYLSNFTQALQKKDLGQKTLTEHTTENS